MRRERSLDALQAYWQEGEFPWNDDQKYDAPIFVDDDGTHCAVAHILRSNGMSDLVKEIRGQNNLGYVADIASMAGVVEAVEKTGLEPEEAAYVQPAYGYCSSFAERFCMGTGGQWPEPSLVWARVTQATESGYIALFESGIAGPIDKLEETFPLGSDFRQNFFELEVGDGLLVTFSEQSRIVSVFRQSAPGAPVELIDEPCDAGLSKIEQEAVPLLVGSYEDCLNAMEQEEPNWVRGFCVQGFSDPQISCPEGELLDYEIGEDGPPVAPAPETPDPIDDDAGSLPAADAGGCQNLPPSTFGLFWLLLASGLLRRRRS